MLALAGLPHAAPAVTLGPLAQEFGLTLEPGRRLEVLGPIWAQQQTDSTSLWSLAPLMSSAADDGVEGREFEFLYPLLTYDRFGTEYRWQLFQLLSFAGGQTQEEIDKSRFTLFPLYFQQRSADSSLNYTAVVPFYGRLQNRLFRDEVRFVLLPLYVQSRKRDVVTDNYLFPIFHVRHGTELAGWQLWPLVGHEHKNPYTRTNSFGDPERVGGHDKFFLLWPLFFDQHLGVGTENPERHLALLPVFSLQRSPQRDSTTVLWPFFVGTDDRGKRYREWGLPWPFVVIARGEGKTGSRVWPLYGHFEGRGLTREFYAWPLFRRQRAQDTALDRQRTRILYFLYSDIVEQNLEHHTRFQRRDFWPLFTWRRDHQDRERLQVLAVLEPFVPNNKGIERNYSPLWSLWRSERHPAAGSASQSLLWNLYRRDTAPEARKCSLLFGLFQYQSSPEGKQWRLFHIPMFRTGKPAPAAPVP